MEILTPVQEQPTQKSEPVAEHGTIESAPNLKHIHILSHLGMKDKIFDDQVMEKVSYISDRVDLPEFEALALKVGNDWTPKIDKIMTIIQLRDLDRDLDKRKQLIREQLNQYE